MIKIKYFLAIVFLLVSLVGAEEIIFTEDFSTNFSEKWDSNQIWGTAGFAYDSFAPANSETAEFWASGIGGASLKTVERVQVESIYGYSIDFDFILYNKAATNSPTVWAQRQMDDSHYYIRAYVGGSGAVDWYSGGGGMTNVSNGNYDGLLSLGNWYTFHAEVLDTNQQIELKAIIYDKETGDIAVPWSATAIDNTAGRFSKNHGFGIEGYYASNGFAIFTDFDNFKVTSNRYCGDLGTNFLDGDISGPQGLSDCYVDLYDLDNMIEQWLLCSDPEDPINCVVNSSHIWLDNDLGKESIVPSPWTPVQVVGGNTIGIWGRQYVFNEIGLPSNMIVLGTDILDEAVRLVSIVNGSSVSFSSVGPLIVSSSDTEAVVEGNSAAGGMNLKIITKVEFDGFARVDLQLTDTSGTATLNKFWLEVPLASNGEMYHLPLHTEADVEIPVEGLKRPIVGEYRWTPPYTTDKLYWVGDNDRGLNLAAENDCNWMSADRNEAQELVPGTGQIIWRYHFVDDTVTRDMSTPLEITYCFMATPVKPVDNWYADRNSSDASYSMDVQRAYDIGVRQAHIHEPWTEIMGYPGTFDYDRSQKLKVLQDEFNSRGMNLCLYTHPVISSAAPEFNDWIELWSEELPPVANFTRGPDDPVQGYNMLDQEVYGAAQSSSWADFYIYNVVNLIKKYGANGVYLDGTYIPKVTTNPNYKNAYVYGTEIRKTQNIFDAREFMKRWYKACKSLNPDFYFQGHMSGGQYFMPTAAFLDFGMSGEQLNLMPSDSELPWSYWRAVQTGRQFGLVHEFFSSHKFQEPYSMALALVHGASVYGRGCGDLVVAYQKGVWDRWEAFDVNNATWVPYWENTGLITSSHSDVKVSYYVKPNNVMLVAATNKRTKPSATVTIDLVGLDLDPGTVTGTYGFGAAFDATPDPDLKLRLNFPEHNGQDVLSNDIGTVCYVWLSSD